MALVATPIGNLEDLSPRAARCLREADRVVAEDTRRARLLLGHLGIAGKRVERLDATVEAKGVAKWIGLLERGEHIAMVSDAGTPGVSDPGAALVKAAAARGVLVTSIPGPSAVTVALAVSGFAGDRFRFFGFLPRKGGQRVDAMEQLRATDEVIVLFEAPQRMATTLVDLSRIMPSREAMVARELSKIHEELMRGTLGELAQREAERVWRGEITVVVGPAPAGVAARLDLAVLDERIAELLASGQRVKDVARSLALESGWPVRAIYQRASQRGRQ